VLRVIDSGALHPHLNMGTDEALLASAAAPPTLRLYRWQPAGLSLGYFQAAAPFLALPGEHVIVRRLTGGGAIYHGDEITFSLAVNADLLPALVPESYELIHGAVREALADIGVPCAPPADTAVGRGKPRPDNPWCFAEPIAEDLMSVSARKMLGSAQRRVRCPQPRVLHHGSLVLRAPAATPFCGAVDETANPDEIRKHLCAAIVTRIADALELEPQSGELDRAEFDHAKGLAVDRYGSDEFTLRR
jgi:lipoate-protein ligase A